MDSRDSGVHKVEVIRKVCGNRISEGADSLLSGRQMREGRVVRVEEIVGGADGHLD